MAESYGVVERSKGPPKVATEAGIAMRPLLVEVDWHLYMDSLLTMAAVHQLRSADPERASYPHS